MGGCRIRLLAINILFGISSFFSATATYTLVRDYSNTTFFSGWDFYGRDVQYLNQADAATQKLAYVNEAGRAIIKVDSTTNVPFNDKRNSIRITSQNSYSIGSLWVIDVVHLPYGCSVWPGFWTTGAVWPDDGEIDIVEAVNLMDHNQMALHSTQGCTKATDLGQTGVTAEKDCANAAGCVVAETKPNSFGSGFAQANGGVFAAQYDVAGIFMWFWSRPNIPNSIIQSTPTSSIDISDWGLPTASYPASTCNISQFFGPQKLILDITLCGIWAGLPAVYGATCSNTGPTGLCYNDNVVGAGSPRYDNAYFEISFIRAYSATTMLSPSLSLSSLPSSLSTLIPSPLSSSLRAPFTSGSPGTSSVRPVVTALGPASTSGADLSTWAGLVHLHAYILFLATFLVASEA